MDGRSSKLRSIVLFSALWLLLAGLLLALTALLPDPYRDNHHSFWGAPDRRAAPELTAKASLGQAVHPLRPAAYLELPTAPGQKTAGMRIMILKGDQPPAGSADLKARLVMEQTLTADRLKDEQPVRIRLYPTSFFDSLEPYFLIAAAPAGAIEKSPTLWLDANPLWPGGLAEMLTTGPDGLMTATRLTGPSGGHLALTLGDDRPPTQMLTAFAQKPWKLSLLIIACLGLCGLALTATALLFKPPHGTWLRLLRLLLAVAAALVLLALLPLGSGSSGGWHRTAGSEGALQSLAQNSLLGQALAVRADKRLNFISLKAPTTGRIEVLVLKDDHQPTSQAEIKTRLLTSARISCREGRQTVRIHFQPPRTAARPSYRHFFVLVRPLDGPAELGLVSSKVKPDWQRHRARLIGPSGASGGPASGRLVAEIGFDGHLSWLRGLIGHSALAWLLIIPLAFLGLDCFRRRQRPLFPASRSGFGPGDWCLIGLLAVWTVACLPAVFQAIGSYPELMTFVSDEPWYLKPTQLMIETFKIPRVAELLLPNLTVMGLTAPLWGPLALAGVGLDYSTLAISSRLIQLALALASVIYFYRLCRLVARPWLSVAACLPLLLSSQFVTWSLTIHPDMFQLATIIAAIYHLALAGQRSDRTHFYIAAALTGLATGSKLYGIFIIPAGLVAAFLWRPPGWDRLIQRDFWADAIGFCLVSGLITWLSCPNYILYPGYAFDQARQFFASGGQMDQAPLISLLSYKAANVASSKLIGLVAVLVWLPLAGRSLWRTAVRIRYGQAGFSPQLIIHLTILAFLFYYMVFYNDLFNLTGGERYPMPFVFLMAVPLVGALESLLKGRHRLVFTVLAVILAVSLVSRTAGLPWTDYLPASITKTRALGHGRSEKLTFMISGPQSILSHLAGYYLREQEGRFTVRRWLADRAAPGSTIYTEAYINLIAKPDGCPSLRAFKVMRHYYVFPEVVNKAQPDYVVTKSPKRMKTLLAACPGYRQMAKLSGGTGRENVYVLTRH